MTTSSFAAVEFWPPTLDRRKHSSACRRRYRASSAWRDAETGSTRHVITADNAPTRPRFRPPALGEAECRRRYGGFSAGASRAINLR